MAIRHISDLDANDSTSTYADMAAWYAEHGPCGSNNTGCTSINFELHEDGKGCRRTIIFEDETQFQAFFPNSTDKAFAVTKIEKVTI